MTEQEQLELDSIFELMVFEQELKKYQKQEELFRLKELQIERELVNFTYEPTN